jgi:hypothetical protein
MSRLRLWISVLTSSVVALISLISVLDDRNDVSWSREERWAVSVTAISLVFSFFGSAASVLPPQKSMALECPLIIVLLGFWCAGLPAILDPDNDLAVSPTFAIANANLFFFSYASLIFSLLLLGSWFEEKNGDEASPTAMLWVLLTSFSIVVMASAISVIKDIECTEESLATCNRTRFAIYGGLASTVVSMITVVLRKSAPMEVQAIAGFMLVVTWACGVSYITFGSGPGTGLGSLYFATWSCFFVSLNVTATCATIYIRENKIQITRGGDSGGEGSSSGDEKVETTDADQPKESTEVKE